MMEPTCRHEAEELVDIAARLLDLPVDPAFRPGVLANMQTLLAHARVVNGQALDFTLLPAPEFVA